MLWCLNVMNFVHYVLLYENCLSNGQLWVVSLALPFLHALLLYHISPVLLCMVYRCLVIFFLFQKGFFPMFYATVHSQKLSFYVSNLFLSVREKINLFIINTFFIKLHLFMPILVSSSRLYFFCGDQTIILMVVTIVYYHKFGLFGL